MADLQSGGLATVEKYYADYGLRAKELKSSGRKVIGYLSALCPVEILTAAGVVPVRLKGNVSEAVTKADAYMETMVCPFVRNVFDAALKGKYAFLDGMVLSHQCDSIDRTYDVWSYNLELPLLAFYQLPARGGRSFHQSSQARSCGSSSGTLEKFTGRHNHRSGDCGSGPSP